jgi:hypothetical protein
MPIPGCAEVVDLGLWPGQLEQELRDARRVFRGPSYVPGYGEVDGAAPEDARVRPVVEAGRHADRRAVRLRDGALYKYEMADFQATNSEL